LQVARNPYNLASMSQTGLRTLLRTQTPQEQASALGDALHPQPLSTSDYG
jgi:hypothetical protein